MGNINIAELLKDCPKGMELYSPIYGVGLLTKVTNRIHVKFPKEHNVKCFRLDGKVSEDGEIMLFPKGKTTWEGFQRPFVDGDILATNLGSVFYLNAHLNTDEYYGCYVGIGGDGSFHICGPFAYKEYCGFATEEEKQKLFQAIKDNGYKWNAETKTLEKLVVPKFKVGDRIKKAKDYISGIVTSISDDGFYKVEYQGGSVTYANVAYQDEWELVPNKFDITTLVPFESRVLVRNKEEDIWRPAIFGCYVREKKYPYYVLGGSCWKQCIPCDCHRYLSGKTDDCDEYFKTWK